MAKLEHISLDESADRFVKMVGNVEKMGAKKVDARYLIPLNNDRYPIKWTQILH